MQIMKGDSDLIEDDGFITIHPDIHTTYSYDDDVIKTKGLPRHGSPQDRGSADAYYGRPYDPHYYVGATMQSLRIGKDNMTRGEIDAYAYGYDNEEDRKDWS